MADLPFLVQFKVVSKMHFNMLYKGFHVNLRAWFETICTTVSTVVVAVFGCPVWLVDDSGRWYSALEMLSPKNSSAMFWIRNNYLAQVNSYKIEIYLKEYETYCAAALFYHHFTS